MRFMQKTWILIICSGMFFNGLSMAVTTDEKADIFWGNTFSPCSAVECLHKLGDPGEGVHFRLEYDGYKCSYETLTVPGEPCTKAYLYDCSNQRRTEKENCNDIVDPSGWGYQYKLTTRGMV